MDDLGELGFWLAGGAVLIAMIWAGARKDREKERQKQETFRMLAQLEGDGKLTPETLKYMRERDAAEQKREHDVWVASGGGISGRAVTLVIAKLVILIALIAGVLFAGGAWHNTASWTVGAGVLLGVWAGGAVLAGVIYVLFGGKKNVPPPGA